jgi:hypothetical protein
MIRRWLWPSRGDGNRKKRRVASDDDTNSDEHDYDRVNELDAGTESPPDREPENQHPPDARLLDLRVLNSGSVHALRHDETFKMDAVHMSKMRVLPTGATVLILGDDSVAASCEITGPATLSCIMRAVLKLDDTPHNGNKTQDGSNNKQPVLLAECPQCGTLAAVTNPARCPRQPFVGLTLVGIAVDGRPCYKPMWGSPACAATLRCKPADGAHASENTAPRM